MISRDELLALPGVVEANGDALVALEAGAVAFVETQTGRYFGLPETVTEYVTGRGTARLYLRDHPTPEDGEYEPVVAVDERTTPGGDPTEYVQGADFELRVADREFALIRYAGEVWTAGYEFGLTYRRGYPAGEEPADIRQLVLDLVSVRWQLRGHEALRSETIGGYSYTRFGASDVDAVAGGWATIEAWRRPAFA